MIVILYLLIEIVKFNEIGCDSLHPIRYENEDAFFRAKSHERYHLSSFTFRIYYFCIIVECSRKRKWWLKSMLLTRGEDSFLGILRILM